MDINEIHSGLRATPPDMQQTEAAAAAHTPRAIDGPARRRFVVSDRRREANRQNAQRSTGPRTPAGKEAVRWNALKEGLLARAVIIRHGDAAEDPREFEAVRDRLGVELQPQGIQEEMAVEEIAVCYWRKQRALHAETGEIRLASDGVVARLAKGRADQVEQVVRDASLTGRQRYERLRQSRAGLDYLIEQVMFVQRVVEATGELALWAETKLANCLGDDPTGVAARCSNLAWDEADEDEDEDDEGPEGEDGFDLDTWFEESAEGQKEESAPPLTAEAQAAILALLATELARLQELKHVAEQSEAREAKALIASLGVPAGNVGNNRLRYDAANDRQWSRAWARLDALQAARLKGGAQRPGGSDGLRRNRRSAAESGREEWRSHGIVNSKMRNKATEEGS